MADEMPAVESVGRGSSAATDAGTAQVKGDGFETALSAARTTTIVLAQSNDVHPQRQTQAAADTQAAQRDRFAKGAIALGAYGQVVWAPPSNMPAPRLGGDRDTFSNWINSDKPAPQTADEVSKFMANTDMNCYQWTTFAALQSGAIDRSTAQAYVNGIQHTNGEANKLRAIYGQNPTHPISVNFSRDAGGNSHVGNITGLDAAKTGDIISFGGANHVMVVTGRDAKGRVQVASFPTVIYGSTTDYPGRANPYMGSFEGFLQANLDRWNENNDGNNFIGDHIRVGAPGFLRRD